MQHLLSWCKNKNLRSTNTSSVLYNVYVGRWSIETSFLTVAMAVSSLSKVKTHKTAITEDISCINSVICAIFATMQNFKEDKKLNNSNLFNYFFLAKCMQKIITDTCSKYI